MQNVRMLAFLILITFLYFNISCGQSGSNSSGGTTDQTTASSSYLPLITGIRTVIEDGVLFSANDTARSKGIVAETNSDGIAITGGFTAESGTYDELVVNEQLYLQEQNGGVVLSRYTTFMDDVGGNSPANSEINFNPAVVILEDSENVAVGDVYTTANVDVSYSGDISNHNYIPSQTEPSEDLQGATITVAVTDSREVTIEGSTVTAYKLVLIDLSESPAVFTDNPFFNNMFSYSWLTFWIARGIGIVGLSEASATSTTATIPSP